MLPPKLIYSDNKEELKLWADKLVNYLRGLLVFKSVQRGTIAITGTDLAATATVSLVDPAKSELKVLGQSTSNNDLGSLAYLVLTNATTITATRTSATSATTTVSWELVEYE